MKYDLEERVAKFGEAVIDFVKTLEKNTINDVLVRQLVRSATSIGANYMEANEASSKKDFRNKVHISKKESNEGKHWLRMIARGNESKKKACANLWKEAHELTLILAAISRNSV